MRHILLALSLALLFIPCAQASLLVNGDAETGDLTGWYTELSGATAGQSDIIASVLEQQQSQGLVEQFAGDYFFTFANQPTGSTGGSGDTILMYQTGMNGLDASQLRLTGMFQTETWNSASDEALIRLSVLDASGNTLASAATASLVSPNLEWKPFEVSLDLSPLSDAAAWKVELFGTVNSGTYTNVFYDNVELQAVPEPSTLAIWCVIGGLGLLVIRRRRAAI